MSSKRTVMLLDFLLRGTEGEEKEALAALYRTAFSQTEEYQLLRRMLNDSLFVGDRGRELFTTGTDALERGMSQTGEYDNVLAGMAYVLENGKKLLEETNAYLHSCRMDPKTLYMISKKDNDEIRAFLTVFVNVFCYYVTVLYGPDALADFRFDPEQQGLDMLHAVNSGVSAVINNLRRAPKTVTWTITRRQFRGSNLIHFDGFSVEYNNVTVQELERDFISVSPFLGYPKNDTPVVCAGIGLFSNLSLQNGASVLSAAGGVETHMDDRAFSMQHIDYQRLDILALVNQTLGNQICAVPPEEIVRALNRFMMIATVSRRNNAKACPYCGNPNGLCGKHIVIPPPADGFSEKTQPIPISETDAD